MTNYFLLQKLHSCLPLFADNTSSNQNCKIDCDRRHALMTLPSATCRRLTHPATRQTCLQACRNHLRGGRQQHQRQFAGGGVGARAQDNSVLFLSPVWPERTSSAAGVRTSDLLAAFSERNWRAAYASSSNSNEHTSALQAAGVTTFHCQPNRTSQLEDIVEATQPSVVVFDRFYTEEAFSFRIRQVCLCCHCPEQTAISRPFRPP
jgi:hypothetical protein